MQKKSYKQTGIRLPEELITGLKREARRNGVSFNAYVESILQEELDSVIPYIDPNRDISPDLLFMGETVELPSQEEIDADPRLQAILAQ